MAQTPNTSPTSMSATPSDPHVMGLYMSALIEKLNALEAALQRLEQLVIEYRAHREDLKSAIAKIDLSP